MSYLIDTDWMIDLLSEVPKAVELLDELSEDNVAITVITYMEVYQG
jgi:predicted nucleic acid-binding protein